MNIKRSIAYYEKEGDRFIGEHFIEANVDILRTIVKAYDDDPEFYMIYPLKEENIRTIKQLFGIDLDVYKYDYFLECSQV